MPPTTSDGLLRVNQFLYRWERGVVTPTENDAALQPANLQQYWFDAATVFTQMPDTPHMLAVGFDAETENVRDRTTWRPLSFNHVRIGYNTPETYSSVSTLGSEQHLAAPGAPQWVPQLLPEIYNYRPERDHEGRIIPPRLTSAGVIGSLPLLLALAAFSGPASHLNPILTRSLAPGAWIRHPYPRDGKTPLLRYYVGANCEKRSPSGEW